MPVFFALDFYWIRAGLLAVGVCCQSVFYGNYFRYKIQQSGFGMIVGSTNLDRLIIWILVSFLFNG